MFIVVRLVISFSMGEARKNCFLEINYESKWYFQFKFRTQTNKTSATPNNIITENSLIFFPAFIF